MNNNYYRSIAALGTALWICGSAPGVFASDNSTTVLPAEGNVVCADYASNKVILSMDTRSPAETGVLSGPENPEDGDASGESVSYTIIDDGTRLGFADSTTPVDYVVIKSGREVSVAMYASGGVTDDENLTVTVDGQDLVISAFSLCYGLGNEALPPPPPPSPEPTKSCDLDAILDATGIECPADGSRALVCNLELDDPFFGTTDGSDVCCVCNSDALPECDPGVPAGEEGACTMPKCDPDIAPGEEGACIMDGIIDPLLRPTEVTTYIEINNDPYYCITRSGKRKCYKY